jgi:hypothetical protein
MSSGTLASPAQKPMATFGRGLELMAAMLASAGQRHRLIARSSGVLLWHFGHVTFAPSSHTGLKQRFGESRVELMAYGQTPWS